jgi:tripartite-type tricarboxylate transporter receptor subunit TctC
MMKMAAIIWIFLLGLIILDTSRAFGDSYPSKTVRIVSAEVGGAGDVVGRIIAARLSDSWGQSVIIDNRTNIIHSAEVALGASPDGYTLLISGSTFWTQPLFQKMPFDVKDFVPVALVNNSPVLIVVNETFPVESIKDLIALAKSKPGVLNFGTGSTGSAGHLAAELLKSMGGINIVRVQYRGAAPSLTGLLAGDVQIAFVSAPSGMPLVKSGKLKALAVTSARPSATAPGVPTVTSYGLPGYEVGSAVGLFLPPKTPKGIVNQLNRDIVRVLAGADMKEKLLSIGTDVIGSSPEEFAAMIRSEVARLGKVFQEKGLSRSE